MTIGIKIFFLNLFKIQNFISFVFFKCNAINFFDKIFNLLDKRFIIDLSSEILDFFLYKLYKAPPEQQNLGSPTKFVTRNQVFFRIKEILII